MSTLLLSDKNVREKQSQIVSKRRQYSDFDLRLEPIIKNDIVPLTDIDAVKTSVRNLILTNHSDRPFQPYLGCNLRALLFEPADQFTIFALHEDIRFNLLKFEPRIKDLSIRVRYDDAQSTYNISLAFTIIAQNQAVEMTIRLQRIR
jgi:hypothetical protein